MASACYVYAIVTSEASLPSGLVGLDSATLTTVPSGPLAAVTSRLDPAGFHLGPEHLLCHEAVVEALRARGPALPVRFGTILADPARVVRALDERAATLAADLERLGDKVEMGLAVLWESGELVDQASSTVQEEPEIAFAASLGSRRKDLVTDPARAAGPGTRHLWGRLREHRREACLRVQARGLALEVDAVLCRYSIERCCWVLPTARLALSAAYLVEPGRVGSFRAALEQVRRIRPGLSFLLSGPWPPYSFVTPPDAPPPVAPGSAKLERFL